MSSVHKMNERFNGSGRAGAQWTTVVCSFCGRATGGQNERNVYIVVFAHH